MRCTLFSPLLYGCTQSSCRCSSQPYSFVPIFNCNKTSYVHFYSRMYFFYFIIVIVIECQRWHFNNAKNSFNVLLYVHIDENAPTAERQRRIIQLYKRMTVTENVTKSKRMEVDLESCVKDKIWGNWNDGTFFILFNTANKNVKQYYYSLVCNWEPKGVRRMRHFILWSDIIKFVGALVNIICKPQCLVEKKRNFSCLHVQTLREKESENPI